MELLKIEKLLLPTLTEWSLLHPSSQKRLGLIVALFPPGLRGRQWADVTQGDEESETSKSGVGRWNYVGNNLLEE